MPDSSDFGHGLARDYEGQRKVAADKSPAGGPSDQISLSLELKTTSYVSDAIDALVDSGRFGEDADAVVEELLRAKLRELELEGWLK